MKKFAVLVLVWFSVWFGLAAVTQISLTSQVQGILPVANGGNGTASPGVSAGQGISLSSSWPTQAIAVSLTKLQTQITGNVTLGTSSYTASSGTFPAVTTSAAGTWLVAASLELQTTSTASAVNFTCELYDGSAVFAQGYMVIGAVASAAVRNDQMALVGVATESGTVTFTARCTSTTASQLMEAAAGNNSGVNYTSTITAVRIQ